MNDELYEIDVWDWRTDSHTTIVLRRPDASDYEVEGE